MEGQPSNRGRGRSRGRSRYRRGRGRGRGGNRQNRNNKPNGSSTGANLRDDGSAAKSHPRPNTSNPPSPPKRGKVHGTGVHVTSVTFASLNISANSQRAIKEVLGYEFLTEVQAATIGAIVQGKDMLARARTGTGKTIAFLLPSIENIAAAGSTGSGISCLVVSPTRELASQIAVEARALCRFHGFKVEVVLGGTNIKSEQRRLTGGADILVATAGRLLDHAKTTQGFVNKLNSVTCFVLDEADQMLDMGFRPDLLRITAYLPTKEHRQTLLFSATVPPSTKEFAKTMLKSSFDYVDTVGESEEQTNARVTQQVCICEFDQHLAMLHLLITEHIKTCPNDYKIIVFFSTARVTGFNAQLFASTGIKALEMHSRKSQSFRTKISKQFRENVKTIMFSSDVSARGVDYPGVTMCIQVGITTREQYIHRVGRTARAGQAGLGVLLLSNFEKAVLNALKDLPIEDITAQIPDMTNSLNAVGGAVATVSRDEQMREAAAQAYRAWLGFYNGNLRLLKWDKTQLVAIANEFSTIMGLEEVPSLLKRTVGKMGLRGVRGLRIE